MNRRFHNKRQSLTALTNKPLWANCWTDQKNFTGHMFNIKLEEKSHKMSFIALPVKIQQSKTNREGGTMPSATPSPEVVRVKLHIFLKVNLQFL